MTDQAIEVEARPVRTLPGWTVSACGRAWDETGRERKVNHSRPSDSGHVRWAPKPRKPGKPAPYYRRSIRSLVCEAWHPIDCSCSDARSRSAGDGPVFQSRDRVSKKISPESVQAAYQRWRFKGTSK